MIPVEQLITNFEAKLQALVTEANTAAYDLSVPLSASMELYARIDRLSLAIKQLQKRKKEED